MAEASEERVEALAARVAALEASMAELRGQLGELAKNGAGLPFFGFSGGATAEPQGPITEDAISWADRSRILPRIATFSFVLVIALILRTIDDMKLVGDTTGVALGMGYAAALMIAAWFLYARGNHLSPVFAGAGPILIALVTVETHLRFQSLPLEPAYISLMATGLFMAIMTRRYRAFTPLTAGIVSMSLAGATIGTSIQSLPWLVALLVVANFLVVLAARVQSSSWLRWLVLVVTAGALGFWGFMLAGAASGAAILGSAVFYLPTLGLFLIVYLVISILSIARARQDASMFDIALPPISSFWIPLAAWIAGAALKLDPWYLGAASLLLSLVHLAIASVLFRRGAKAGGAAFAIAALIYIAVGFPHDGSTYPFGLAMASLLAFFLLARRSTRRASGSLRMAATLAQGFLAFLLAGVSLARDVASLSALDIVPAAVVAVVGIAQYRWARATEGPADSHYYNDVDARDRLSVVALLGGLLSGLMALRPAIALLANGIGGDAGPWTFHCLQTVAIDAAAMALALIAASRRDQELRNVAIAVTAIGGVKVFMLDLLSDHGLPLVLSVFSFGLAAALLSIVLGRWQRQLQETPAADAAGRNFVTREQESRGDGGQG